VALAEARRVLAPGGLLIVTAPNAGYLGERLPSYARGSRTGEALPAADAGGHLFAFRLRELRDLLAANGFQVVRATYTGSVVMSDRLVLKALLPISLLKALSRLVNAMPGGAALSYNCVVIAKRSTEADHDR
jgi:hypothetical protein